MFYRILEQTYSLVLKVLPNFMGENSEMQFSLTTENHKNKTTYADIFHINISLHILTQGRV